MSRLIDDMPPGIEACILFLPLAALGAGQASPEEYRTLALEFSKRA